MLPTSDFCFKELMQNSKVRKGIISALLGISPEEIAGTKLLPTSTTEEYPDGKLGILDVLIKLENGTQVDDIEIIYSSSSIAIYALAIRL